jgi:hypothetical protein
LSLNVFGDGLRDALDPKARIRIEANDAGPQGPRRRRALGVEH